MSETLLKCCWLNPENLDEGCDNLAAYDVWERDDDGDAKCEGNTYCCAAHIAWAMPPARREDGELSNGAIVLTLPTPGSWS